MHSLKWDQKQEDLDLQQAPWRERCQERTQEHRQEALVPRRRGGRPRRPGEPGRAGRAASSRAADSRARRSRELERGDGWFGLHFRGLHIWWGWRQVQDARGRIGEHSPILANPQGGCTWPSTGYRRRFKQSSVVQDTQTRDHWWMQSRRLQILHKKMGPICKIFKWEGPRQVEGPAH